MLLQVPCMRFVIRVPSDASSLVCTVRLGARCACSCGANYAQSTCARLRLCCRMRRIDAQQARSRRRAAPPTPVQAAVSSDAAACWHPWAQPCAAKTPRRRPGPAPARPPARPRLGIKAPGQSQHPQRLCGLRALLPASALGFWRLEQWWLCKGLLGHHEGLRVA